MKCFINKVFLSLADTRQYNNYHFNHFYQYYFLQQIHILNYFVVASSSFSKTATMYRTN